MLFEGSLTQYGRSSISPSKSHLEGLSTFGIFEALLVSSRSFRHLCDSRIERVPHLVGVSSDKIRTECAISH